jgi:hypothetical protein
MNIFYDTSMSDETRRRELYKGAVFVQSPTKGALKLCQLAREMVAEAFRPFDPMTIHEALSAEKCAEILTALKPKFIHHPEAKESIQEMLAEIGCDPGKTYFDVPRMRTAFPGEYLKSGIAYAFHPHRDTWYSAPMCQINWWMPFYELNSDNCMAIHPHYFDRPIRNGSGEYNYQRWVQESRFNAGQHVRTDTRVQPHAEQPIDLDPQIRLVCPTGSAYMFSAAQLHSTVPNTSKTTRFSIDFRTVHLDDVVGKRGAANIDSACTGTTMGDYLRATDLAHLPEEVIAAYLNCEADAKAVAGAGSR